MPVYLFTYHTYRSWMPDHKRGWVKRNEGVQPTNLDKAQEYSERAKHDKVILDPQTQKRCIDAAIEASNHQGFRLHGITTESSHLHVLVSWKSVRGWMRVRSGIKSSISRALQSLTEEGGSFLALSRGASRKRVLTQDHFDYHMSTYLPSHSGWRWFEDRGWSPPRKKGAR